MPTSEPPGPVEPTEFVLRRIHIKFYDSTLDVQVMPEAFKPTESDTDGISFVREDYTEDPDDALVDVVPEKRHLYYVGRIPVAKFIELGLSVEESRTPTCPGHSHVPQIKFSAYKGAQKPILWGKMIELAKVAGGDIVYRPPPAPPEPTAL